MARERDETTESARRRLRAAAEGALALEALLLGVALLLASSLASDEGGCSLPIVAVANLVGVVGWLVTSHITRLLARRGGTANECTLGASLVAVRLVLIVAALLLAATPGGSVLVVLPFALVTGLFAGFQLVLSSAVTRRVPVVAQP